MNRIKLPGQTKNKKILLIVLVLIAIGLLFHEYNINRQNIKSEDSGKEQQAAEKNINKEDEDRKNVINEEKEINNKDTSITNTNLDKKTYSKKENDLYNEAYTAFFSHEYVKAINMANDIINEFPSNAMGYNIMGIAKAYNGDYDGGLKDINKSLEIDENYGYARFNKALTYELYGNMDEALKWYNNALAVEEYVWSYYGIASIYGRQGDINNTMKYLNKAIQMDAGVKEVAKTEKDFDPVKNFENFKQAVYN